MTLYLVTLTFETVQVTTETSWILFQTVSHEL